MGFWTDWLDPNIDGKATKPTSWPIPPGSDGRSKWDKLCGVPMPSDTGCSGCNRSAARCKCDPKLGRPRRWYE